MRSRFAGRSAMTRPSVTKHFPLEKLIAKLTGKVIVPAGSERKAICPFHDDHNPSLRIDSAKQVWFCDPCAKGGNAFTFVRDFLGLDDQKTVEWFKFRQPTAAQVVGTYPYHDERGNVLFEVCRLLPKRFLQRRTDQHGYMVWNVRGTRRVLYRLPHLTKTAPLFITEGEKKADRLVQLGLSATTCPGGAGKWDAAYDEQLRAAGIREVVVLPDNDEPGERHANSVAAACLNNGITVQIVRLDNLPPKGDIIDWLDAGHTKDALDILVAMTPPTTSVASGRVCELFTPLKDFLAEPDAAHAWLVDNRLAVGGFSMLVAKPKVGKSTTARHLCLAVARGEPWLGHATTAGRVLYFAPEEKRDDVRAHFRLMGANDEDVLFLISQSPDDAFDQLSRELRSRPTALVVIDSLQRVLKVKNLNDYSEVTEKVDPYLFLARETETHILLCHHMGKGERIGADGILGSTALYGSVDTVLMMRDEGGKRVMSSSQRKGGDLDETVVVYDPATGFVTAAGPAKQMREEAVAKEILEFLGTCTGGADETQIRESVTGRTQLVVRVLQSLLREGRVLRVGKGVRGKPHEYSLPSSGGTGAAGCAPDASDLEELIQ